MLSHEDEIRAVAKVTERLSASFPDVPADLVTQAVSASHNRFESSPIRDFVPVLVERMARSSLVGHARGVPGDFA